ncbi:MAG: penicillin-binding protein 2 [Syntrophaceae bacterium]
MKHSITPIPIEDEFKRKATGLIVVLGSLLALLVIGLLNMQIFLGDYYEELSRNNRMRFMYIKAPRGRIVDRQGVVLADNRPSYNIMVIPEDIADVRTIARRVAGLLDKDAREIEDKIKGALSRPYDPIYIAKDMSFEQLARVEMDSFNLPGISIDAESERDYLFKDLLSHTLGFVGEISAKQLKSRDGSGYIQGDVIGKTGVEAVCEETLRGRKGDIAFEVDALGRKIKVLEERPPIKGREVKLTIDSRLQSIAKAALGDKPGAIVAMVPATGEVLAMASSPSFDPGIFLTPLTPAMWKEIVGNPMHPLENRALRGQYAPGSIFKVIVGLAGLTEGVIGPHDRVFCSGYYNLGSRTFRCWKRTGHGYVDFIRGLGESCDVYFYTLGRMLGIDLIARYATDLGLGRTTGIELNDAAGIMPSQAWKRKRFKGGAGKWYPGETINTAIGQGYTMVTPIQVAKAMSAVVNGGKVMVPHVLASTPPKVEKEIAVSQETLSDIKAAMKYVVQGDSGTARVLKDPMFSIGGKTGTAQVARLLTSKLPDESDIPYHLRDHAWFFGFSPVETPEIVVVAVAEHGGHGGSVAAPMVGEVIKGYYFLKGYKGEQLF